MGHQRRQALVLDVELFIGSDDATALLKSGQLLLRGLQSQAIGFGLLFELFRIFAGRIRGQTQRPVDIRIGERIDNGGRINRIVALVFDFDGGAVTRGLDIDGLEQLIDRIGKHALTATSAAVGLPLRNHNRIVQNAKALDGIEGDLLAGDHRHLSRQIVLHRLIRINIGASYRVGRFDINKQGRRGTIDLLHREARHRRTGGRDQQDREDQPEALTNDSKQQTELHTETLDDSAQAPCCCNRPR